MLKQESKLSTMELFVTGYLCLVIDLIAKPGAVPIKYCAAVTILASVLDIGVVYFLIAGITDWKNGAKLFDLTDTSLSLKPAFFCGFLLLVIAAGDTVATTFRFLRSASDWQLSFLVFLALILAVGVYASKLGVFSIARTAEIVLVLLALSVLLVVLSTLGRADLQNLKISADPAGEVLHAALRGFSVSPSLFAWFVLVSQSGPQKQSLFFRVLLAVFGSYVVFTLVGELVLGGFASGQSQPFYTLARIGNLSVFRRLDSLHSFVWALVLVQKLAVLFYTAGLLLNGAIRSLSANGTMAITAAICAVFAILLSRYQLQMLPLALTVATILVFLLASLRKGENPPSES